jgi:outer membrane protein assembly factor BamB
MNKELIAQMVPHVSSHFQETKRSNSFQVFPIDSSSKLIVAGSNLVTVWDTLNSCVDVAFDIEEYEYRTQGGDDDFDDLDDEDDYLLKRQKDGIHITALCVSGSTIYCSTSSANLYALDVKTLDVIAVEEFRTEYEDVSSIVASERYVFVAIGREDYEMNGKVIVYCRHSPFRRMHVFDFNRNNADECYVSTNLLLLDEGRVLVVERNASIYLYDTLTLQFIKGLFPREIDGHLPYEGRTRAMSALSKTSFVFAVGCQLVVVDISTETYFTRNIPAGGEIRCLACHDGTLFVGTKHATHMVSGEVWAYDSKTLEMITLLIRDVYPVSMCFSTTDTSLYLTNDDLYSLYRLNRLEMRSAYVAERVERAIDILSNRLASSGVKTDSSLGKFEQLNDNVFGIIRGFVKCP